MIHLKSYVKGLALPMPLCIRENLREFISLKIAKPDLYTLPNDLYVPEHALYIKLASFQKAVGISLYLIKQQELDILALPMI